MGFGFWRAQILVAGAESLAGESRLSWQGVGLIAMELGSKELNENDNYHTRHEYSFEGYTGNLESK